MIRHIVLFRVVDGTTKEQVQKACDSLEALVGVIPSLRSLKADIDLGVDGNVDFGLVAELDDHAALDVFSTDPEHMRVAYEILEFRKDIAVFDVEF